eukprot:scaffold5385_cov152-Amphora_coffeaeformis.AAC.1
MSATVPGPRALYSKNAHAKGVCHPTHKFSPVVRAVVKHQRLYKIPSKNVLPAWRGISSNLPPIWERRNKYKDQQRAPPITIKSPRAKPPLTMPLMPPDKSVKPPKARMHPSKTVGAMDWPATKLITGVRTTLNCVKKEALALATDNKPNVNKPCAPKFQTANSAAANQKEVGVVIGLDKSLPSSCDWSVVFLLLVNKRGTKQAVANHPRVADNAEGSGGSGKA